MGNCPSSFRAQFTPNHESTRNGTTDIILAPSEKNSEKVIEKTLPVSEGGDAAAVNGSTDAKTRDENTNSVVPLIAQNVDLCTSENAVNHHTNLFDVVQKTSSRLVIRRGSAFKIILTLNRSPDPDEDIVCLVFTVKDAPSPSYSQGTQVLLPVLGAENATFPNDAWQICHVVTEDKSLIVDVVASPTSVVGEWILEVDTRTKKNWETAGLLYKVKDPIILLFNPWCEQDTVYLPESEKQEEYLLSDTGLIWRGSHNRLRPCIWNFAQFEENILECCLYLLAKVGRLSVIGRSDPVRVARHISAVVNSRDDSGVLVGNWSGDYKGGDAPTSWGGSQIILQKFYKTKKPVKYGQCWVFSGIFITVCRALGIPSRAVTNFSSAHDTHNSLTIDCFFDNDGKPVDSLNIDSVWNFHVWTEVWMQRPDLEPGGYGGWQAVDSTPQEESDGIYQCGPSSVAAIKRGEVMKAFDTQFLFAEVNADKVYWRYHGPNQPLKLIDKSTKEIGQCISTKAIGKFEREDITHEYKHVEHTQEEREVMLRALRQCKNAFSRYYLNDDLEDVQFTFSLLDDIIIGAPFTVKLGATNKREDDKEYTIKVSLRVDSTLYTGHPRQLVKKDDFEIKLGAGIEQEMTMNLNYPEYEKALVDQCAFLISATAHVVETGFDYCAQDDFRVRMPDINIQVDGEKVQGQPLTITASFKNPLPKPLKNGVFTIEGPGLGKPLTLKCKGSVRPAADAKVTCKMTPKLAGLKTVVAKFRSRELEDVDGYHVIHVNPNVESSDKETNSHL